MIRVKAPVAYFILIVVLVGAIFAAVRGGVTEIIDGQLDSSVSAGAVVAETTLRLHDDALLAKAEFVAGSDRLYRSLQGEFVGKTDEAAPQGEEPPEEQPQAADFEGQRHLDAHEKLLAQKYHLDELVKQGLSGPIGRAPHETDVFMVLDADGVGVAALGKDLYKWFGDDVGKKFPSVKEVAAGGEARIEGWMWAFGPNEERRFHRMAIVPLRRQQGEKPAGVVVLGTIVTDGMARASLESMAAGESANVAYFSGKEIVASTFGSGAQTVFSAKLGEDGVFEAEGVTGFEHDGKTYRAAKRLVAAGEAPFGVVVVAERGAALRPLDSVVVNVLLIGAIVLALGLFVFFFMFVRFVKGIEELETGMQEVIAGGTDYVWQPEPGHALQNSLAQSLNLMSAFLQGKPMPDEDEAGGSWGDLMPGENSRSRNAAAPEVQGVDLAALSAPPKSDSDSES